MSPIDKISDIRRLPLLGTIRTGIKKEGRGTSYPQAVDYFVCPPEVQAVYGEKPKELKIMFPADDLEEVAPQYYKCYSYSQGLLCKGTGTDCMRKVDSMTGAFANRDTKQWVLTEASCDPEHCEMLGSKQCRRTMSLYFILYEVPGLGVYRLNTSSWHSIVNINSQLAKSDDPEHVPDGFLRQFTRGRIAFIPLVLFLKEQPVTPMGEGRKTVYVLNVRADVKLADIIQISRQKPAQVLLPTLEEEEPPDDLFPEDVIAEATELPAAEEPPATDSGAAAIEAAATPAPSEETTSRKAKKPVQPEQEKTTEELEKELFGPGESPAADAAAIDWDHFDETLKAIKWGEGTCKSWISSNLHVDTEGELRDIIKSLPKDKLEALFKELRRRRENTQPNMFK